MACIAIFLHLPSENKTFSYQALFVSSYFHTVSSTDVPLQFNRDQCMRLTVSRGVELWNRRAVAAAFRGCFNIEQLYQVCGSVSI